MKYAAVTSIPKINAVEYATVVISKTNDEEAKNVIFITKVSFETNL